MAISSPTCASMTSSPPAAGSKGIHDAARALVDSFHLRIQAKSLIENNFCDVRKLGPHKLFFLRPASSSGYCHRIFSLPRLRFCRVLRCICANPNYLAKKYSSNARLSGSIRPQFPKILLGEFTDFVN